MRRRRRSALASLDGEHDLRAGLPAPDVAHRLSTVAQRIGTVDPRREPAGLEQLLQEDQILLIVVRHEEHDPLPEQLRPHEREQDAHEDGVAAALVRADQDDDDLEFVFGLDLILDGLERAKHGPQPRSKKTDRTLSDHA
jgi:hypothetical protein